MKDKESNIILDMDNVEIEYNEDFDSNKTKSLIKFPNKNKEFNIDNPSQNFSKSLNFSSHKCYAPKIKYKQILKKPSPIFFADSAGYGAGIFFIIEVQRSSAVDFDHTFTCSLANGLSVQAKIYYAGGNSPSVGKFNIIHQIVTAGFCRQAVVACPRLKGDAVVGVL